MKNKITPKEALADLSKTNMVDGRLPLIVKAKMSVIEQALDELEETKILCESFKQDANRLNQQCIDLYKKSQKQTQILEVLKKKNVELAYLRHCINTTKYAFNYYNRTFSKDGNLTKQEFDLLKEWLNND